MRTPLTLVLAVLLAIGTSVAFTSPATAAPGDDELGFLRQLNETRVANGRAPLVLDLGLSADARNWSGTMASQNRLFHTPSTQILGEVLRVVTSWIRIGENVGVGYGIESLHNAFWGSSGHRANMLGDFNRVGVGVRYGGGRLWVTFRFVKGPPISGTTGLGRTAGFPDVPDRAYYADAVEWLVDKGITTGVGTTGLYKPGEPVTRAQMGTFLWRLAGQPRATATRFADVPTGSYYAAAVDWLRARGLTTGVAGGNRYAPNELVTRAQMVTFLHRFAGTEQVDGWHGFVDVGQIYAADAITWAAQHRITTGTGNQRFSPHQMVTRDQMSAFLHRLAGTRTAFTTAGVRIP